MAFLHSPLYLSSLVVLIPADTVDSDVLSNTLSDTDSEQFAAPGQGLSSDKRQSVATAVHRAVAGMLPCGLLC